MYVSVSDLRDAIEPNAITALFADNDEGEVADGNTALVSVLRRSHAEVTSNLAPAYGAGLPSESPGAAVSELLRSAELAYATFFAYSRKPAYAKKVGGDNYLKELWSYAQDRMDRLKDAVQEIAANDSPPPAPPANVGGVTFDKGPKLSGDSGVPGAPFNSGDY